MLEVLDESIRKVSLGGKARLETNISHLSEPFSQLIYDLELLYIK